MVLAQSATNALLHLPRCAGRIRGQVPRSEAALGEFQYLDSAIKSGNYDGSVYVTYTYIFLRVYIYIYMLHIMYLYICNIFSLCIYTMHIQRQYVHRHSSWLLK